MLIIGDENIDCEKIEKIASISNIDSTTSNSTVLYNFDFELLKYTQKNNLNSAIIVKDLQELIYASTFTVKYIIVQSDIAKEAQDIVNNYMLDSKILVIIKSNNEIVQNALLEIDGVIYQSVVQNGTK